MSISASARNFLISYFYNFRKQTKSGPHLLFHFIFWANATKQMPEVLYFRDGFLSACCRHKLFHPANAHAVMDTPRPYGFGKGLTNGPITELGFPCRTNEISFTDGTLSSTWFGTSPQPLHLTTAATHGGGHFTPLSYKSKFITGPASSL